MIESIVHVLTFLVIIIPIYLIWQILRKEVGDITKSLTWVVIGLIPLALYHFLEFLEHFGIMLLPAEGAVSHVVIDHVVAMIAILSFTWFLYFFKKKYIDTIYGDK